ncbi:autophagy-related protein 13 [[Candida] railenensis]|uniref:Autophagy-related protein 13 n=1 Tax=[Candida] railenensis TaxID=45579 RepID=A0A9P0QRW0_9ASCO|nr:autophagy-related protein 13 [[Candida] railenensis]
MDHSYTRKQNSKLTQVIQNFFAKTVQIVHQSRVANSWEEEEKKINKWFNLLLPTISSEYIPKEDLRLWKTIGTSSNSSIASELGSLPPMIIETYLDLRRLGPRQTIVLKDDTGNPWTVAKGGSKKQEIVLERWLIEFDPLEVSGSIIDELPLIYKQAIILFRSLYAFTRLMPAYKLYRSLNKSKSHSKTMPLSVGIKVLDGKQPISSKGRVGLSKSIIPSQMYVTESHMQQKHFQPIQTTLGTLKVSIAYRIHHNFCVHDSEEVLSTHFISIDKNDSNQGSVNNDGNKKKRVSIASTSVSPCSSLKEGSRDDSPRKQYPSSSITGSTPITPVRPSIQPFKIGSISNSPPPGSSSLERRISITSNKSTSNASLVAMLRNPRSSTSSSNTASNIPISNTSNRDSIGAFPRSVSSLHTDELYSSSGGRDVIGGGGPSEGSGAAIGGGGGTPTPRFSSSFGSRASRRYSSTSMRNSSIPHDGASLVATSSGSVSSSGAPMSGLYIDDDISDFVKMIDSKTDLRFSSYNSNNESSKLSYQGGSNSQIDALSRFQSLKHQHQQLGESVSASLVLQYQNLQQQQSQHTPYSPTSTSIPRQLSPLLHSMSRASSRKSSHSMHSPPPSLGSYDNSHLPSIHSRLREQHSNNEDEGKSSSEEPVIIGSSSNSSSHVPIAAGLSPGGVLSTSRKSSYSHSNNSFLRSSSKLVASPVTSTTIAHAHKTGEDGISGLATTPSTYNKKQQVQGDQQQSSHIRYEDVFEYDDDDDEGEDFYLSKKNESKETRRSRGDHHDHDEDDDELLFTMSDMNLTK